MSELAGIVDELKRVTDGEAWHGPSLREVLDGVTAEQAAAKPVPGAHSIWELVLHLAAWNGVFIRRLMGQRADEPEEGDFPPVGEVSDAAWAQARADLARSQERLRALVSELNDARLAENVAGKDYTLGFMARGIIHHMVYHTGQMVILKKARLA